MGSVALAFGGHHHIYGGYGYAGSFGPGGGPFAGILPLFSLVLWMFLIILGLKALTALRSPRRGGARVRPSSPRVQSFHLPPAPPVLASDAEREETAHSIGEAMAEGRLGLDEGRQRIDAAYAARYRHDLSRLVADLPPAPPRPVAVAQTRTGRPALLVLAAIAVSAAVVFQAVSGLWEAWPVALLALAALAAARRG